jgi:GNAT superfamily N-acetyltransferase
MPLVFSYGTLQQRDVQLSTFGRVLSGTPDELARFEIGRSSGHANLVFRPRSTGSVPGTAFEITDAELAAADRYEHDDGYTRVEVPLASGRPAWVYLDIGTQRAGEHSLVTPGAPALWQAYHAIRRAVLFEARGDTSYNENHPDDIAAGNYPKLLLYRDEPVGAVRVDLYGPTAVLRRVAIRADQQRRGHGQALLSLAVEFAHRHDCLRVESHVATDAVEFYRKSGFSVDAVEADAVLMSKDVAPA